MRPENLFQLTVSNRALTIIRDGLFIRSRESVDFVFSLFIMDSFYYELTWNTDQSEILYVSFVDDADMDYLFPGVDENIHKRMKEK